MEKTDRKPLAIRTWHRALSIGGQMSVDAFQTSKITQLGFMFL